MKFFKLFDVVIISCLTVISCNKKNVEVQDGLPYLINFEQCISKAQNINISDLADTIDLIELKSPEELPISMVWDFISVRNHWFIHTSEGVYKFTNRGEYVATISNKGQGPSEYASLWGIAVDTVHNELIINDIRKLIFFDLDGNYLRMEQKKGLLYRCDFSGTTLWGTGMGLNTHKYTLYGLDRQRDTVYSVHNPFYGIKPISAGGGSMMSLWKPFYHYKDELYLNGPASNDTIYQLKGNQCIPYAAFDMGKYKLPLKYEAWNNYEAHWKNGYHYWNIPAITEDERYLFILAQRYAPENGDRSKRTGIYRYVMYDKQTRKGFMVNEDENMQIVDDILGGPPIWPTWITNDYYVGVINPYSYENRIEEGDYSPSTHLQEIISSWNYDTNIILMLCHKKKMNQR